MFSNVNYAQTASSIQLQAGAVATLPTSAGLTAIATGDFNHDNRRASVRKSFKNTER